MQLLGRPLIWCQSRLSRKEAKTSAKDGCPWPVPLAVPAACPTAASGPAEGLLTTAAGAVLCTPFTGGLLPVVAPASAARLPKLAARPPVVADRAAVGPDPPPPCAPPPAPGGGPAPPLLLTLPDPDPVAPPPLPAPGGCILSAIALYRSISSVFRWISLSCSTARQASHCIHNPEQQGSMCHQCQLLCFIP
jgi:hypothetical protein